MTTHGARQAGPRGSRCAAGWHGHAPWHGPVSANFGAHGHDLPAAAGNGAWPCHPRSPDGRVWLGAMPAGCMTGEVTLAGQTCRVEVAPNLGPFEFRNTGEWHTVE